MKKRVYFGIMLIFMLVPQFLTAQVKAYVGVVRQQYYPEYVEMFKTMSKELKDEGYNTYSKAIDNYLEGGFGSGFVWVAPDGTNYVITNRHVVSQAASASIEFEDEATGNMTKYEGLKVVVTDDDIDIAILAFKDGEKPFTKGLVLSDATLSDGQEVWSAGFPGLGNDPVWQFGKGTITNAHARIKELLDPEVSTIIQHSAQIDSGNSGGPLLIATGKKNEYQVIGINAWKAVYRDSTNFSIPTAVIKTMISRIDSKDETVSAETRAEKLAGLLNDKEKGFADIVNYISYHRASVDGQKELESVLRFAPTSIRSQISDAFGSSPAEGLRYACAYQIAKKYGSTENKQHAYKVEVVSKDEEKVKTRFIEGEGEEETSFEIEWIKEHGLWRIDAEEKIKEAKKEEEDKKKDKDSSKSSKIDIMSISDLRFKFGVEIFPMTERTEIGFTGELQYFGSDIFGITMGFGKLSLNQESISGGQIGVILRVPVNLGKVVIEPFGEAGIQALGFMTKDAYIVPFFEGGLVAELDTSFSVYPSVGVSYKIRKFKPLGLDKDEMFSGKKASIVVFVSLGF